MDRKFDETISALKCSGKYSFSVGEVALALREGMARTGVELDNVQFIDTSEVILHGQGVILSVCLVCEHDHDILVAAETPSDVSDRAYGDALRLMVCAWATRIMCERFPVGSISWWHRGAFHVTEPGRNFSPLFTRKKPARPNGGLRRVAERMTSGESIVGRAIRRHLPRASDIIV